MSAHQYQPSQSIHQSQQVVDALQPPQMDRDLQPPYQCADIQDWLRFVHHLDCFLEQELVHELLGEEF